MAMAVGMSMANAVVPTAANHAVPGDAETKLATLKNLLDQQLITQAEYDAKKREILAAL
jgi:hypothetical protein